MAMRKYQSVEKTEVLAPSAQKAISTGLHSIGKTSARDLSEEERRKVLDAAKRV